MCHWPFKKKFADLVTWYREHFNEINRDKTFSKRASDITLPTLSIGQDYFESDPLEVACI